MKSYHLASLPVKGYKMSNIIADIIKEKRSELGLTQEQFGGKYNVTASAILKFEKGQVRPNLNLWLEMAKDFEIPEKQAVLMWVKLRLPEEYQDVLQIKEKTAVYGKKALSPRIRKKIEKLSPNAQREAEKFIDRLLQQESGKKRKKKKLKFDWVGSLSHLKDKYTSVELQKKSLEERD